MTPVFANSAWIDTSERLILRTGGRRRRRLRVRYGFLNHPDVGPVLIDTGYTPHSVSAPGRSAWLRAYGRVLAPKLNQNAQADHFLGRFGVTPRDVAAVIVTHFHADHVSGLAAFPNAKFIASQAGYSHLLQNSTFRNIRHGVFRELLPTDFDTRLQPVEDCPRIPVPHLPDGHDLFGDESVLAIPLPGHAAGHFGVLFPQGKTPLLYATDTQWLLDALPVNARPRVASRLVCVDYPAMCRSADQVAEFRRSGGTVMLCHDDAPTPFDLDDDTP